MLLEACMIEMRWNISIAKKLTIEKNVMKSKHQKKRNAHWKEGNRKQQNGKNAMRSRQQPLPNVRIKEREHKNRKWKQCATRN